MSGVDQLVALGFDRYWVEQALELTNFNTNYAMEWLLSDEFKLAKQAYEQAQQNKPKTKANPKPQAKPKPKPNPKPNPARAPSLQLTAAQSGHRAGPPAVKNQQEYELDYNWHQPDLKPQHSIMDLQIGVDRLLAKGDEDESDSSSGQNIDELLKPSLDPNTARHKAKHKKHNNKVQNSGNGGGNHNEDEFMQKLKNQVQNAGQSSDQVSNVDWVCHGCGANVSGKHVRCNLCNAAKARETDWFCNICTFVNDEDTLVCEMCLSNKPIAPASTAAASSSSSSSSSLALASSAKRRNPKRVSLTASQTWSCPACEYHNIQTKACRMCGYEQGNIITKQRPMNKVPTQHLNIAVMNNETLAHQHPMSPPKSPTKHVSADSKHDFFDAAQLNMPDAPNHSVAAQPPSSKSKSSVKPGSGGQVMVQRKVKKKSAAQALEEEDDSEESSLSEVVGAAARTTSHFYDDDDDEDMRPVAKKKQKGRNSIIGAVADAAEKGDHNEEADLPFKDFDIPMMDNDTDLAFDASVHNEQSEMDRLFKPATNIHQQKQAQNQASAASAAAAVTTASTDSTAAVESKPKAKAKEELTGFALLKSMYPNQQKQKIKLKLKVGTVVDIYSSSKQDWVEGIIKEIKGDLICIVYGRKMKWLKKNSRQLRPKQQMVSDALSKQQSQQSQSQSQSKPNPAPQAAQAQAQPAHNPMLADEPLPSYDAFVFHGQKQNEPASAPPAAFSMQSSEAPLIQQQQAMFDQSYAQEVQQFQPPPPNGPPPAFAADFGVADNNFQPNNNVNKQMYDAQQHQQHQPPPQQQRQKARSNSNAVKARADEFDYDVTFTTSVLGLELYPDKDGKNCIVGKCLSKTAKKFVDPGSIIVKVNDMWIAGMSYDMVRDAIKQAARHPPLKVIFRVKIANIGKRKQFGNERGYLKVKVVAGVQLKHRASYCVVQVGNARLSTREVPRDEHPEWQEMLTFKNFRPDNNKKANVAVFDHSTILKDKKIGTVEYVLPVEFNKLQRDTLELKNTKGKLSGVVILNTIIVHKTNSIKHLRQY